MTNKNKFIIILITLFGSFWILFYLYLWFFSGKPLLLLQILLAAIFLLQCCHLFRKTTNKIVVYMIETYMKYVDKIYKEPLKAFFDNIFKNIPYIGDILMFLLQHIINFYDFCGYYAICICCILFFLLPKIFIMFLIVFKVFIFDKDTMSFFLFFIIFYRLFYVLYWILNEFSQHNKQILEKYLIIRSNNKNQLLFDLNPETIKKGTQAKLNKYAAQYMFFREGFNYTQSTIMFEKYHIKPWFNPFFFSVLFISLTKTLLNMFHINIPSIYLIPLFLFVVFKEYSNIRKDHS